MQSNNTTKIVVIVVLILVILAVIGFALGGKNTMQNEEGYNDSMENKSAENMESLETISASSSVESDIDAYLDASNNPSNPNDFNDSYSDLNQ